VAYPSPIRVLESELRDWVNEPPRRDTLARDPHRWGKLCSAMDLLGDTQLAIEAFLDVHPDVEVEDTDGDRYLVAYGALQAMFLQQDALCHIHEAFEIDFQLGETLTRIREIRNDSIGHPSNRKDGRTFHFIVRVSLSRQGFDLISRDATGESSLESVNLIQLTTQQQDAITAALSQLLSTLRRTHAQTMSGHGEQPGR